MAESFTLTVNGREVTVETEKNKTLLYVLRELLDLTGAKCGCASGDCGACKVLLDGEAVNSCLVQIHKAAGHCVTTIEGLAKGPRLHPIQRAFIETGAIQCGYCTPGMIISAKALLDRNPNPSREDIEKAIDNNLCRCTGYVKIIEAIQLGAKYLSEERGEWE